MFDKLEDNILKQTCKWLDSLIRKYHSQNSLVVFFPQL